MKKNGFTLAEVLITLAIIGVVATMTLPALLNNTGEQQYKTGLKKGINTLTEAAQINLAIDGVGYADLSADDKSADAQSLFGLLSKRAAVDSEKSGEGAKSAMGGSIDSSNYAVFFRDGSALIFASDAASNSTSVAGGTAANRLEEDGLPYGITAIYDTNGAKGPNALSNCNHTVSGATADLTGGDTSGADNVCTPTERVIKDRFGVRLRGNIVVPNGPAARWAFEN